MPRRKCSETHTKNPYKTHTDTTKTHTQADSTTQQATTSNSRKPCHINTFRRQDTTSENKKNQMD